MNDYKKKLSECKYALPQNGYVVDDFDAEEAAKMAYNKGIDDCCLILLTNLDKKHIQGSLMSDISKILNTLKQ